MAGVVTEFNTPASVAVEKFAQLYVEALITFAEAIPETSMRHIPRVKTIEHIQHFTFWLG